MKISRKPISFLLALCLVVIALALPVSAAGLPFTDVPANAWYKKAVAFAYENGLFKGTGDTTFSPASPMTRAMFVQVLANKTSNFIKADWEDKSSFSDVDESKWYAAPVEWAYRAGLISGVGEEKFAPEKNVTREQMAVIMYNYAKKTGNDTSFDSTALSQFPDADSVSSWAEEAMQWAVTHKIINGSDGELKPGSNAKRCEVAQVAVNADPILESTIVDPTPDDLPEGALTYREFVAMFPNIRIMGDHYIRAYVDGPSNDRAQIEAVMATGIRTLRLYAIAHIQTLKGYYNTFEKFNDVILGYAFDDKGNGSEMWLYYYPKQNNRQYFEMGDLRYLLR